jgi:hypothetical protein
VLSVVEVGCIADIFEDHVASVFMVEAQVEDVVGLYMWIVAVDHEGWGGVPVGRFSIIVRHTVNLLLIKRCHGVMCESSKGMLTAPLLKIDWKSNITLHVN